MQSAVRRGESGINCLLALEKPLGMSSHDVVSRVRRILGERRVGHAGTLDPQATGVLVVGVGQATRLLGLLTLDDKRYMARIAFGSETTTDDEEGEVTRAAEVPARLCDPDFARAALSSLVGTFDQKPPAYSAISVDGKRAYARARKGEDVDIPAREVSIYEAQLIDVETSGTLSWHCVLHVSKGTYIRSIARDLGRSLDTAAHLSGLVRIAAGPVTSCDCITLEELEQLGPERVLEAALDPVRVMCLPHHELNDYEREAVSVGRRFTCRSITDIDGTTHVPCEGERVALVSKELLMGVWEQREGRLRSLASFPHGVSGVSHDER